MDILKMIENKIKKLEERIEHYRIAASYATNHMSRIRTVDEIHELEARLNTMKQLYVTNKDYMNKKSP